MVLPLPAAAKAGAKAAGRTRTAGTAGTAGAAGAAAGEAAEEGEEEGEEEEGEARPSLELQFTCIPAQARCLVIAPPAPRCMRPYGNTPSHSPPPHDRACWR